MSAYSRHQIFPGQPPSVFCGVCDKTFTTEQALNQHLDSTVHNKPEYYCSDCDRVFNTRRSLEQHLDSSFIKNPDFFCQECNWFFEGERAFDKHLNSSVHHQDFCCCRKCNRNFSSKIALEQHTAAFSNGSTIACDGPNRPRQLIRRPPLNWHRGLRVHRIESPHNDRSHGPVNHATPNSYLRPPTHGQIFPPVADSNQRHISSSVYGPVFSASSDDCNRQFYGQPTMIQYLNAPNPGPDFFCKRCDRVFVDQYALDQHLLSRPHRPTFLCGECDRDFVNQYALEQHMYSLVHRPANSSG